MDKEGIVTPTTLAYQVLRLEGREDENRDEWLLAARDCLVQQAGGSLAGDFSDLADVGYVENE